MFKILEGTAPNYLISLLLKCDQDSEQRTTLYPTPALKQIVSSTLFFFLP